MWLCITTNWLHEDKLVIQGCRGNWFDKSSTCWTLHSCLLYSVSQFNLIHTQPLYKGHLCVVDTLRSQVLSLQTFPVICL